MSLSSSICSRPQSLNIFSSEVLQSGSAEAELQIFGSQDRAEVGKRNFPSLEVLANQKCGSGTSHSWQSRQSRSGTSDLWQSMQSGSAEAELQIIGSTGRAEVRKWNFRSLAVQAEKKCGNGTSHLWQALTLLIVTASVEA